MKRRIVSQKEFRRNIITVSGVEILETKRMQCLKRVNQQVDHCQYEDWDPKESQYPKNKSLHRQIKIENK